MQKKMKKSKYTNQSVFIGDYLKTKLLLRENVAPTTGNLNNWKSYITLPKGTWNLSADVGCQSVFSNILSSLEEDFKLQVRKL